MRLVFGHDDLVAAWVGQQLGVAIHPPYAAIGATRDDVSLCAGAVFNDWNGSNIEATAYATGFGAWRGMRVLCSYAFAQLGAQRLSVTTKRSNRRLLKLLPRLGFEFEGSAKRYYGPTRQDDGMRFVLFPERAHRWMLPDEITGSAVAA